jgi:hypothetical protein
MKLPQLLASAAVSLLTVGCQSANQPKIFSGTTDRWYAVTASQTPFYRYGPQQGNGPDLQLPHDSIMKVIRPSFGYVKVELQDGENGYVANEDIRPAPATLVAEKLAPPPELPFSELPPPDLSPASTIADQGERFQLNSDDPRLIAPPEPLPEPSPLPGLRD